jgi:Insertion domain in 60S ribosomal protein L10P
VRQVLGIATKLNKGSIEIVSDVQVVRAGEKVGASEATLLSKLGIKPFTYGLMVLKVRSSPGHQLLALIGLMRTHGPIQEHLVLFQDVELLQCVYEAHKLLCTSLLGALGR